jgi:hypothetical protein
MSDAEVPQVHVQPGRIPHVGSSVPHADFHGELPHVVVQPGQIPHLGPDLPHAVLPVPIQESLSYSIDSVIQFFDEEGRHRAEEYNDARFFLGEDGKGAFTFMVGGGPGAVISIEGSGSRSAAGDTVEFRSEARDLSGVFDFARGATFGDIKLDHGSVHLTGRAVVGAGTL